jgi:hypothetical protein
MGSLTVPDTCGALREPAVGVGKRYKNWFNDYAAASFNTGTPQTTLTAEDCYQLRCSLLHENSQIFQKVTGAASRVDLSGSGPPGSPIFDLCLVEDALALHIPAFCERILAGLKAWEAAEGNDPAVIANASHVVRLHPQGLAPYVVGYPILG